MTTTTRFISALTTALGGLSPVRRASVVFVAVVVLAGIVTTPPVLASDDPIVRVRDDNGLYHVATTFAVSAPIEVVRTVLTDYEHIPEFLPDVKSSRVRERHPGRTVVEQEAVARVLVFSRRIHLTLEVVESPGRIQFRDICGKSFVSYEGSWVLEAHGGTTTITYSLSARPSSDVPAMIVRRLFSRDVEKTIALLRREMISRLAR
jgi:uncharacterized membrane protein